MIDVLTRNINDNETRTVIESLTESLNSKPFLVGNWSFLTFEVKPDIQLVDDGIPVGTILSWSHVNPPDESYKVCDGNGGVLLSKEEYPEYYLKGRNFGGNSTHAAVPDLRGLFLRMPSGTSGSDPDAATRTEMAAGGNVGNNIGSLQGHQMAAHYHVQGLVSPGGRYGVTDTGINGGWWDSGSGISSGAGTNTSTVGGAETRPKNANVNLIIKVKPLGNGSLVIKVPHSLKFTPTDFIISSVVPNSKLGANSGAFARVLHGHPDTNNKTIAIETNQPCKVRMFIGSYEEKR